LQLNRGLTKCLLSIFAFLVLTIPFCRAHVIGSLPDIATDFALGGESSEVWSRSNITIQAMQDLTITPSNPSLVELSPKIDPTTSALDMVRGFKPVESFNSEFNSTLARKAHVGICSLRKVDDELLLFLNASSAHEAAIAAYNLSFTNPVQISESDFISLALSTSSTYNSSEAYIGVSLLLSDQQGNSYYVSIQISDQYSEDSFSLSVWFLGHRFTKYPPYPKYPKYDMKYNSTSGPWFIQLPLAESFALLNLSSAWLDGLLIGGEIYLRPPFDIEKITEVEARFHYILVHEQPFMINQEIVNSTVMVLPFASSLRFSGILCESVNVIVEGSLEPSKEERRENATVNIRETLFDLSETLENEASVQAAVRITVFTKAVKKCAITLNNKTMIDVTDSLLRSNTIIYNFPPNVILLKVHLILYRFNAWFFKLQGFQPSGITKKGLVDEHFFPDKNEGTININSSEISPINLAICSGNLVPSEIRVNGIKKSLDSLLILNEEMYWTISNIIPDENVSLYTVKYILSDELLHQSPTKNPFPIYVGGHIFEIFTPFNVEGQEGTLMPLTIRTYNPRTYTLKVEYDSSRFEADRDELMVYASRARHFEYFMFKPLRTGQTIIILEIVDPMTMDVIFSFSFLVSIKSSVPTQMIICYLLGIAVLSLVYIFTEKSLMKWMSDLRHR